MALLVLIALSCFNISAPDPSDGSGTCSDPTPGNGTLVSDNPDILPNGTYSVGTIVILRCYEEFVGTGISTQSVYVIRCIEHGLWTYDIR